MCHRLMLKFVNWCIRCGVCWMFLCVFYVSNDMIKVSRSPSLVHTRLPANTCQSSQHPLPLHWLLRKSVSNLLQCGSKFRDRWWLFLQFVVDFCHGALQLIVNNNGLCTMFLLLQRLNSKFVFQWNFAHVTDAALKIYQYKQNLST